MIKIYDNKIIERRCNVCLITKDINDFHKDKSRKFGFSYTCKKCRNEKTKKYMSSLNEEVIKERDLSTNKERRKRYYTKYKNTTIRDYAYRTKYGITLKEYEDMERKQNGKCLICNKKSNKKLVIDHNHINGKIRGLLCHSCNHGLGCFLDDEQNLLNAIDYLVKYNE